METHLWKSQHYSNGSGELAEYIRTLINQGKEIKNVVPLSYIDSNSHPLRENERLKIIREALIIIIDKN